MNAMINDADAASAQIDLVISSTKPNTLTTFMATSNQHKQPMPSSIH